ncbi:ultraviolet-B receptor UVR8-like [Bidens hawaiensis]|uniref:ultraviolet-B receptor UVR8-like n=1 Tax=Bidens hawaiensis TaxID=980011 RepID=UPI0040498F18
MENPSKPTTINDLPSHLILEILTSGGRLDGVDLVFLELTNSTLFRTTHEPGFKKSKSLVDSAAFHLCNSHPVYSSLNPRAQQQLLTRCSHNWKRVLRFLQSVHQSSDMVQTSAGNKLQVKSGRYHTLLVKDSIVYACGSSLCGVLGHGPNTTQCVAFTPIKFPFRARVTHVSASHNHAAFVTQSGEVFTCGDNSSFCCGHSDTKRPIFKPRLVEALKKVPCKQVATGVNFTMFLTKGGQVYTCGTGGHGQLGHGDTMDRPTPKLVEALVTVGPVVQVAAGPSYALAVTSDGTIYSFGSGTHLCLGHGEPHNEPKPRPVQWFRRKGVHVVRVSAGDEHAVALDSNGLVYTWGKGYCGALGHGDENDKTIPELVTGLDTHIAVQVCASKRKTFVLMDSGCLYGFGWTGFGSLGFPDRSLSEKVLKPSMIYSLKDRHISQVSIGLYHSVVVTNQGLIFGFGDNERAQLGHDKLRNCLNPVEILVKEESRSVKHL